MIRTIAASICVLAAATAPLAAQEKTRKLFSYYDPSAPAASDEHKAQAAALTQRLWTQALESCRGTAIQTVDDRLMIELDKPEFTLVSMRLPPAASEVGYEYRGIALATADRWRWATRGKGKPKWSAWDVGDKVTVRDDNLTLDRGNTTLPNVVLKFDVWMKDGKWAATSPISSVNYDAKPVELAALPEARAGCESKMAGA